MNNSRLCCVEEENVLYYYINFNVRSKQRVFYVYIIYRLMMYADNDNIVTSFFQIFFFKYCNSNLCSSRVTHILYERKRKHFVINVMTTLSSSVFSDNNDLNEKYYENHIWKTIKNKKKVFQLTISKFGNLQWLT